MGSIKINVEVTVLFTFFGLMIVENVLGNLVIYRTCYVVLGHDEAACARLGRSSDAATAALEKLVQPRAAVINMARSIVEGCVSATLCFFVGPWSDKFGRRPVLLAAAAGLLLTNLLMVIYSSFDLSPWYLLICSMPYMMIGGIATYMATALSYVADTTTDSTRGIRLSIFDAIIALGMFLGTLASSHIFDAVGYVYCFLITVACSLLALLYTVFFIPESLENVETTQNKFSGFFDTSNIKEMLKAPIKPRQGYDRTILIIMIIIQTIVLFVLFGESSIFNLYLREKFHFTLEEYTTFNSISNLVWISGASIGVWVFHKILKVTESVLILCGYICMVNSALLYGLAQDTSILYAACAVKFLGALLGPMTRSLISKKVHKNELGKIFSLMSIAEAVFTLGASPLYVYIYNSTINTDSATIFFVTAGLYTANVVLISIVLLLQNILRCSNNNYYTPLVPEYGDMNEENAQTSNILINASTVICND